MKSCTQSRFPIQQRGMTLVEVMVGLVIGMIGMLVIFQTVSVWESRTRATTAGTDSQTAGTIAMYSLERDMRLAGQGFGTASIDTMGCNLEGYDDVAATSIDVPMVPVFIVDNDLLGLPDEIATLYGASPYFSSDTTYSRVTADRVSVYDRSGFKSGDLAVLASASLNPQGRRDCTLVEVTDDPAVANAKLMKLERTSYDHFYENGLNKPSRYNTVAGPSAATYPSGRVFSLGPQPRRNVWSIQAGVLGRTNQLRGDDDFLPVAEGVIDMKAEYGFDTDTTAAVAINWSKTLPGPNPDWTTVRAIRVAMLVRSRNFERVTGETNAQVYTAPNPVWHDLGGTREVPFVMKNVDGTADSFADFNPSPNNWRNYRYTVYEKVFPLRNVIWGQ